MYEHVILGDQPHTRIATLPDMSERTITISNFGKTFNTTGWKIGWATGSDKYISAICSFCQYTSFSVASILQEAAGRALMQDMGYFEHIQSFYTQRYKLFYDGLRRNRCIKPFEAGGSYFLTADISDCDYGHYPDFATYLIQEIGVSCIPLHSFCSANQEVLKGMVRFNFAKSEQNLNDALQRLSTL